MSEYLLLEAQPPRMIPSPRMNTSPTPPMLAPLP